MPWYKFYCNSGPGHQSSHEFYKFYENPLSRGQKQTEWEEAFEDRDWPIGGTILVKNLPADVRREKIDQLNDTLQKWLPKQIKEANKLRLALLRHTPGKCSHKRYKSDFFEMQVKGKRELVRECKFCGKVSIYGTSLWKKPTEKYKKQRRENEQRRKEQLKKS